MPPYYYSGRSGDSFVDATIHADGDCHHLQNASGSARPINESSIANTDGLELCGSCVSAGNDSDGGGESGTDD